MKVLLTGARGFVGPYLTEALRRQFGNDAEITGTVKDKEQLSDSDLALDITDRTAVESVISDKRPTHIVHLAGIAAPTAANADPETTWQVHLRGTLELARAILKLAPDCCLVHVGSGMVYGDSAKAGRALDE